MTDTVRTKPRSTNILKGRGTIHDDRPGHPGCSRKVSKGVPVNGGGQTFDSQYVIPSSTVYKKETGFPSLEAVLKPRIDGMSLRRIFLL